MARGALDSAGHPAREGRHPGPHRQVSEREPGHRWWQVGCLTGVDYFSTIGYQPAIAFLAAGILSPLATIVLVLVTLLGALPVYRRVATESPYGEGSLAMLERIGSWWTGKILVLVLLGFAATDFLITMTLSAADASTHLLENPYAPHFVHGHQFVVTLVLLAALAAVFLRGFGEAIGIAVVLVAVYLALNAVVVGDAQQHRRDLPGHAGRVRAHPARLLRLDRGQPADPLPALHLVGLGRGRAGHPRDPAPGRTRPVPPPARARGLRTGRIAGPGHPRITAVSLLAYFARRG